MGSIRSNSWLLALVLLLTVTLTGCPESGASTAHVRGKVTIGGNPIPSGSDASITFRPTGPNQATAVTVPITDGMYDCPEAPMGSVSVEFSIREPLGVKSYDGTQRPEMQWKDLVPEDKLVGVQKQIDGETTMDFDLSP